ncbi:MAG: GNAT family N-acetyltransferase [Alphaproteobacteria bacterium]|nr:GNAT family N-acetyltransferase [Alphaproteobacteria bacterium]
MQDVIKKAEVSDWPDLMLIFDRSLRSTDNLSDDDWKKLYERLITYSYPNFDTYIYVKDGKSVAYISYWREKKLIKMLYVLPEYTNRGIGQRLIKHVIDTYDEPMTIGVKASNDIAMHIYTKFGFKIIKEEEYDASGIYYPHYVLERKI